MRFIGGVIEKLQRHPKRIVFPEGTEPRVLQAARQFYSLRLGAPIDMLRSCSGHVILAFSEDTQRERLLSQAEGLAPT
jgi:phosphotransacetylase